MMAPFHAMRKKDPMAWTNMLVSCGESMEHNDRLRRSTPTNTSSSFKKRPADQISTPRTSTNQSPNFRSTTNPSLANERVPGDKKEIRKRDGRCVKCGREGHNSSECKTGWKATTPPPWSTSSKSTSTTNTSSALIPIKKQKTETGFLRITELGEEGTSEEDHDNTKDSNSNQDSDDSKNE